MTKLELMIKTHDIESGAEKYFQEPRAIAEREANINLIAAEIERMAEEKKSPADYINQEAWAAAVKSLGHKLVPYSEEIPEEEPVREILPPKAPAGLERFGPFHSLADARKKIPGSVFRDYMYDKNPRDGKRSAKSQAFVDWLEALQTYQGAR